MLEVSMTLLSATSEVGTLCISLAASFSKLPRVKTTYLNVN